MAFESLTERLNGVFKKLRGKGKLNEADIKAAMREVRMPSGSAAKPGKGAVEGRARTIRAPAADAAGARIVFRTASR